MNAADDFAKDLERQKTEANQREVGWECMDAERCVKLEKRIAELEAKVADLDSLIDFAEISIDEAVEAGWEPPSADNPSAGSEDGA